MNYYKVTNDSKFIGVGASYDLRRYQRKHGVVMACWEDMAEYICIGDELYHDHWMVLPDNNVVRYIDATVSIISKEEYDMLVNIEPENVVVQEPEPIIEDTKQPDEWLEFIRQAKNKELSSECEKTIRAGFDWNNNHYSLELEDQLELQQLAFSATKSQYGVYPYHADGCPYVEMTADEILELYDTYQDYKSKNRIYFNRLKNYVNTLSSIQDIADVYYGMEIE